MEIKEKKKFEWKAKKKKNSTTASRKSKKHVTLIETTNDVIYIKIYIDEINKIINNSNNTEIE